MERRDGGSPHATRAGGRLRASMTRSLRVVRRVHAVIFGVIALLVIAVIVVFTFSFADEPLRKRMEAQMNAKLTGYDVDLPRAHFSLFGVAATLENVRVSQMNDTGPPVLVIPKIRASLQWRELLALRLVSDVRIETPQVRINLAQLRKEVDDSVKVKDRGWQDALAEIHPFKINLFEVVDGDFVYIDTDVSKPLHAARLQLRAENIRNIHEKDEQMPSKLHAEAEIFGRGHVVIDGVADFLARPTPGFRFDYAVRNVPIDELNPVAHHASLKVKGGSLGSEGTIETGPNGIGAHIRNVMVNGLKVDYLQKRVASVISGVAKETAKANEKRRYTLIIDTVAVTGSELGVTRTKSSHTYRLFLSNASFHLQDYSNHFVKGPATATLRGRFMGQGRTAARLTLKPSTAGRQNFDLAVAVDSTPLTTMNELLRAHGKFDVTKGSLEFYSELSVAKGQMVGYAKPIIKDIRIYDPKQDGNKSVLNQLWQLILTGASKIFENRKTEEIATRAKIAGPVGETSADAWEMIGAAWENAFVSAIRPGFDRIRGRTGGP
jgi:hypothetical protein